MVTFINTTDSDFVSKFIVTKHIQQIIDGDVHYVGNAFDDRRFKLLPELANHNNLSLIRPCDYQACHKDKLNVRNWERAISDTDKGSVIVVHDLESVLSFTDRGNGRLINFLMKAFNDKDRTYIFTYDHESFIANITKKINKFYKSGNRYGNIVMTCLRRERFLVQEFVSFDEGFKPVCFKDDNSMEEYLLQFSKTLMDGASTELFSLAISLGLINKSYEVIASTILMSYYQGVLPSRLTQSIDLITKEFGMSPVIAIMTLIKTSGCTREDKSELNTSSFQFNDFRIVNGEIRSSIKQQEVRFINFNNFMRTNTSENKRQVFIKHYDKLAPIV